LQPPSAAATTDRSSNATGAFGEVFILWIVETRASLQEGTQPTRDVSRNRLTHQPRGRASIPGMGAAYGTFDLGVDRSLKAMPRGPEGTGSLRKTEARSLLRQGQA
jgi:hypothetical protein